MNGRDSRDDHLFLWCALLIFVFAVLPALYVAHADDVNRGTDSGVCALF